MKLKLHMDDYVMAIGGVGLLRLQDWACRHLPEWQGMLDRDKPVQARDTYVEVDSTVLEHLPEWYFKYLMDKHSVSSREREKFRNVTDFKRLSANEQITRMKDSVNSNVKKLDKYFPDHPHTAQLHEVLKQIRSLKPEQAPTELERLRDHYIELLATEEFEERLTLNVVRSFLYKNFYGQASMLQRTRSHFSLQQNIDLMLQDYVLPVIHDVKILEWIRSNPQPDEKGQQELVDLFKQAKQYPPSQWANLIKKLKPHEIHDFLQQKLRCSFEDEWFASARFEEMVFAPLGISGALPNFNWNFEHHQMPISSWVKLVLFMAPAGLTRFTRFYDDNFETYYSFVYRDGYAADIFQDNNELDILESNESFDRLIPKLVERESFKARREAQANIQIIEFFSDTDARKTILNYYHIPRHMIQYFTSGFNKLQHLSRTIRDPFLKLVMESIDPIQPIWQYMQRVIRGRGSALSAYLAIRERWIIEMLKKKEGKMLSTTEWKKRVGYIYHVSQEGVKVRKGLEKRSDKQAESTDYVSSGSKRAAGIAHRLLNAAKANDKQQFLDTTIRLYLMIGEPVPNSILNVLHEEKIDFTTWSGAFIAGLLGNEQDANETDSENKDE